MSDLAAMVISSKDGGESLLVLADYLEDKQGLAAVGKLLRAPDLQALPRLYKDGDKFDHYPLGRDVFVWLTQSYYFPNPVENERKPCVLIGLYAHPIGKRTSWVRITRMVALEETGESDPHFPAQKLFKKDVRVEEAREELAAFVKKHQK